MSKKKTGTPAQIESEPTLTNVLQALETIAWHRKGLDDGQVALLQQAIKKIDQVYNEMMGT